MHTASLSINVAWLHLYRTTMHTAWLKSVHHAVMHTASLSCVLPECRHTSPLSCTLHGCYAYNLALIYNISLSCIMPGRRACPLSLRACQTIRSLYAGYNFNFYISFLCILGCAQSAASKFFPPETFHQVSCNKLSWENGRQLTRFGLARVSVKFGNSSTYWTLSLVTPPWRCKL